jgi:hypothetical protein
MVMMVMNVVVVMKVVVVVVIMMVLVVVVAAAAVVVVAVVVSECACVRLSVCVGECVGWGLLSCSGPSIVRSQRQQATVRHRFCTKSGSVETRQRGSWVGESEVGLTVGQMGSSTWWVQLLVAGTGPFHCTTMDVKYISPSRCRKERKGTT